MRRALTLLLLIPVLLAASLPARARSTISGSTSARLGPRLREALVRGFPEDGIAVRVTLRDADLPASGSARSVPLRARQSRVLAAISQGGFRLTRRYQLLAGFAGRVDPVALELLRANPEVVSIHLDGRLYATLQQGVPLIGADGAHGVGLSGLGVTVAVLDTGIDTDHPHLSDDLVAEHCFCGPSCCPGSVSEASGPGSAEDDEGHGTAVSGIITAPFSTPNTGVAPDAGIVAVKVLDANGTGRDSDVDAGLDWVLANRATYGIGIVNLSLGDGSQHDNANVPACANNPTVNAIEALYAAGVAVFAASGNEGFDAGISAPACNADAISVGGVYDDALGSVQWCTNQSCTTTCTDAVTAADVFVCHVNSGSLLDLLAPDWRTTVAKKDGGVGNFGGTSAATPYAAGQAALLLEADPTLTPAQIRTLLTSYGPMVTNPENGQSYRRSDVGAALATLYVCGDGVVDPTEQCDDGGTANGDCCSATCTFESAGSPCADGDACTDPDTCDGSGSCGGPAVTCDDSNVCTDDSCNPASGCVFTNNTAPCNDGDACTTADACSGGACLGGPPLDCDDGDACTADGCDGLSGCFHDPIQFCAPVPASPVWARALVAAMLLAAAGLWSRR